MTAIPLSPFSKQLVNVTLMDNVEARVNTVTVTDLSRVSIGDDSAKLLLTNFCEPHHLLPSKAGTVHRLK